METLAISAFPGCGKTYVKEHNDDLTILDSDSSNYSWIYKDGVKTEERDPNFPANYMNHIKEELASKEYDFIFVSSHETVRKALKENDIPYISVIPDVSAKEEWLQRFKERGDSDAFIKTISDNWDQWIADMNDKEKNPSVFNVYLKPDEYLDHSCLEYIYTCYRNM